MAVSLRGEQGVLLLFAVWFLFYYQILGACGTHVNTTVTKQLAKTHYRKLCKK